MSNVQVQLGGNSVQVQVQSSGFARANAAVTAAAASATAAAASAASAAATLADAALKANNLSDLASASTARTNLGVAIGSNVQAYSANLDEYAAVNPTAAGLALLDDADASAQRTTLGLGSIATQAASAVAITGGSIAGITDLAVADGGTGASSASAARDNLGLTIGTNVQAYDADLGAIAGLTSAADKMPYATGAGAWAMADLSSFARTLLATASNSAFMTALGNVASSFISFIQSGTGAVTRTLQAWARERPISVKCFGALCDGSTDDSAALIAASAASLNLIFPEGTCRTSAQFPLRTGQTITLMPGAIVEQISANTSVFDGNGVSDVTIRGPGTVKAVGSMTTIQNGAGILFRSSGSRNRVVGVKFTNARGYGVCMAEQTYGEVSGCVFVDSPGADTDNSDTLLGDIGLIGSTSHCLVIGNRCVSGSAYGVTIQTVDAGDVASYNVIIGNTIQNSKAYGVLLYKVDPTHTMIGNVVSNNSIKNTTGSILATATSAYPFGAGIYNQGADDSVIDGNSIDGTHTFARTFAENLTPAAIGSIENTRITITNNVISNAEKHGIEVADPNAVGDGVGMAIVANNQLTAIGDIGIYVKERGNVRVTGNAVDGTGGQGVLVNNTVTKRANVFVEGNTILNATGSGVNINFIQLSAVRNNRINGNANYPILINNADDFDCSGNKIVTTASLAIVIDTACARFTYRNNFVSGSATPHYLDSRPIDSSGNTAASFTTLYGGTYATGRTAAPASGTWAVGDRTFNTAPAAAGYSGWICTTAGSPGTHKGVGLIEA